MESQPADQLQIGQRLRTIRQKLRMSQKELGENLAISGCYLSMLENGLRQPSEHLIRLLCVTQGVNRQWLESGRGEIFYSGATRSATSYAAHLPYDRKLMKHAIHLVSQVFIDLEQGGLSEDQSDLVLDCYEQLVLEQKGQVTGRKV